VDICRILFYLGLFLWFLPDRFEAYAYVPQELYLPPLVPRWLGFPAPTLPWIAVARVIWLGSLLLSSAGLFTRLSTGTAFLLGLYLLSLDWCFGNTAHTRHLVVLCLGVMAFARCSQQISLDAWLARRLGLASRAPLDESWSLRLCQLCWCLMFFNAGLSKLRNGGLEFLSGSSFQYILLVTQEWYARDLGPISGPLRQSILANQTLATCLSAGGLFAELLAPLAFVVSGRWRALIVGGNAFLQIGAYLLFYIVEFRKMSPTYLFWVPWSYLLKRLLPGFCSPSGKPIPMTTHLKIEGMTCQHCQQAVERSLAQVPGAAQVRVDLASHSAWVSGDCKEAELREAVDEAGFTLLSISVESI
jgi:copper chaperone